MVPHRIIDLVFPARASTCIHTFSNALLLLLALSKGLISKRIANLALEVGNGLRIVFQNERVGSDSRESIKVLRKKPTASFERVLV